MQNLHIDLNLASDSDKMVFLGHKMLKQINLACSNKMSNVVAKLDLWFCCGFMVCAIRRLDQLNPIRSFTVTDFFSPDFFLEYLNSIQCSI